MSRVVFSQWIALVVIVASSIISVFAEDRASAKIEPEAVSGKLGGVEELTRRVSGSVVTVESGIEQGRGRGVGSGFVISADGLIATNLHVIGQGKTVTIRFDDGHEYEATHIHASDRKLDLAIVRIDPEDDHDLVPFELGKREDLEQGAEVVAYGNPQGFAFSVVTGVVSAWREIEGREMMQIAIPVEQGNSGGPVVDRLGKVHGIMTMKSVITENLGFAAKAEDLQLLLDSPNPVPMNDWITIGALDPKRWETVMGADWSQRGGTIQVREAGTGFGGRSLCIAKAEPEGETYEVEVEVRLDDEAGAAGLVFCSDGSDVHYGFYPTGGKLRLTRFDGPVVYTWTILQDAEHAAYRKKDWNRLRVHVEAERLRCYVNEELVFDSPDTGLRGGQVGLAKFRQTQADFRGFRVGRNLQQPINDELASRVREQVQRLSAADPERAPDLATVVEDLAAEPDGGAAILSEQIRAMESAAAELRSLQAKAHQLRVGVAIKAELDRGKDVSVLKAALLVAKLDQPRLDIDSYLEVISGLGREFTEQLPKELTAPEILDSLSVFLFEKQGFHGSRFDYYNPANSYLNQVLDDREGIPITLSILYIDLARRAGVDDVFGVPLPTYFVVGHRGSEDDDLPALIDVYGGGVRMTIQEAQKMVIQNGGGLLTDADFAAADAKAIIQRMLANLTGLALESDDPATAMPYLDTVLLIDNEAYRERFSRSLLRYREGDEKGCREDIEILIEQQPPGMDLRELQRLLDRLP